LFTTADRERLRATLIKAARADERISGAAVTGSAARDAEDDWSDIDLAFGIRDRGRIPEALSDWTESMYRDHGAVHTLDVARGSTVYRVFFLANTMQVDLAFFAAEEFGALAPTFRLLFGESVELPPLPAPSAEILVGTAWLHAIHARSCIKRGKPWQAEYMISAVRDNVLALVALRLGLPAVQGRGMDALPADVTRPLEGALVGVLESDQLRRALAVAIDGLAREVRLFDAALAERLDAPLHELAR
jgi:predicted nucleotidyltransferase